ncbi:uncharacterized protein LOC122499609 [Leptopilina heterotoma]|uniref:uncharacterized protein LOC122499609 n=1 Tax=Leptopilina heterotoma TaxID=63436 RepID=UPI001CA94CA9|nr:uncharacterized protein LOC122499609 [Leptopilina heterotoma]
MIDRFSRWAEAVPLRDIEAKTIYRAFVDNWLSRFGTPSKITTDQGKQFESRIFKFLLHLAGCHRLRTTAYHPASNGMIERWHRTLKAAIMCHSDEKWTHTLSTVLLGLRTTVLDSGASPAEYVYGTTLKIPGEFILPDEFKANPQFFLEEFREHMRLVKPVPVTHKHKRKIFVFKDMYSCSHVFLKSAPVKKSLESPYSGPHKVVDRTSDRVFEIEVNGEKKRVSVENIKPAYFTRDDLIIPDNVRKNAATSVPVNNIVITPQNDIHFKTNNVVPSTIEEAALNLLMYKNGPRLRSDSVGMELSDAHTDGVTQKNKRTCCDDKIHQTRQVLIKIRKHLYLREEIRNATIPTRLQPL